MTLNYYTLKKEANQLILSGLKFLQANPGKSVSIPHLALEFQREFGFNKRILMRMLEPYLETKQVMIEGESIKLYKEVIMDGVNNGPDGQPEHSSPGTQP